MSDRPNILIFFTDQQRPDSIGCYGQALPTTPNLDALAADGVRFDRAYTPNPLCGPCRASLQTGLYPTATGCHVNNIRMSVDADTVAKQLSSAGYAVGYLGKWHLASEGPKGGPESYRTRAVPEPLRGGYKDYWLAADALEWTSHGYGGFLFDQDNSPVVFDNAVHRVDFMTDHLVDQIGKFASGDRPFFLMASYLEPHHQNDTDTYDAPRGLAKEFADAEIPGDLAALGGSTQEHYTDYLGCVAALDQGLGRVMTKLKELEIADNTLVIFISDHGCHFKTRNGEYKRSCHDASIRVPLILRGPGFRGGKVDQHPGSLLDVPATALAAAGIPVPPEWHGRPLQHTEEGDWRSSHFSQLSESQVGRCLRTKRWTYSVRVPGTPWRGSGAPLPAFSDTYVEDFLYDNDSDPYQLKNLVLDPGFEEVRKELAEELLGHMRAAGEPAATIQPAPGPGPDLERLGGAESALTK